MHVFISRLSKSWSLVLKALFDVQDVLALFHTDLFVDKGLVRHVVGVLLQNELQAF